MLLKTEKIKETKSWFFIKINEIDNPLVKLKKKKSQINKIRNEKGEITTTTTELQRTITSNSMPMWAV